MARKVSDSKALSCETLLTCIAPQHFSNSVRYPGARLSSRIATQERNSSKEHLAPRRTCSSMHQGTHAPNHLRRNVKQQRRLPPCLEQKNLRPILCPRFCGSGLLFHADVPPPSHCSTFADCYLMEFAARIRPESSCGLQKTHARTNHSTEKLLAILRTPCGTIPRCPRHYIYKCSSWFAVGKEQRNIREGCLSP